MSSHPEEQTYFLDIKPQSVNSYYRIFRNRYTISPSGRRFKKEVQEQMNKQNPKCLAVKCVLQLEFHFKDRRKHDIDNYTKNTLDSLKEILYDDDDQIYEFHCKKFSQSTENSIRIRIYPLQKPTSIVKK